MENVLQCIVITLTFIYQIQAFFGLTSKTILPDLSNCALQNSNTSRFCDILVAHRKLYNFYQKEKALADTLINSIQLSALECERQFEYHRWNCSIDSVRINLLKEAYPETAFLYSITSASLVHTVARGCSSGKLRHCTCDEDTFNATENKKTWLWGGCGDNVKFGARFTRKFLLTRWKHAKDLRALIERHNSEVGIKQVVRRNVLKVCKCHGVSGSCTVRTCWKQLSPFNIIGSILRRKYLKSTKANVGNDAAIGRSKLKRQRQRHKMEKWRLRKRKEEAYKKLGIFDRSVLLYLSESPNFCNSDDSWPGTKDRRCRRGINCDTLCCGRGYNSRVVVSNVSCKCRVVWCCTVHCHLCQEKKDVFTCK
ncbi:protein Wnt-9a-like isoform X1 [Centruroides sculpturatus]|uniref:protein Wnt-9a-like isoform X1 n=1 Tax=Centruroides sculpturatus TaxID=218467 RepID=UPI000C6EC975|nr:protein Wnt-9a-like isoform X1 [Centruroides sculpturatus]